MNLGAVFFHGIAHHLHYHVFVDAIKKKERHCEGRTGTSLGHGANFVVADNRHASHIALRSASLE